MIVVALSSVISSVVLYPEIVKSVVASASPFASDFTVIVIVPVSAANDLIVNVLVTPEAAAANAVPVAGIINVSPTAWVFATLVVNTAALPANNFWSSATFVGVAVNVIGLTVVAVNELLAFNTALIVIVVAVVSYVYENSALAVNPVIPYVAASVLVNVVPALISVDGIVIADVVRELIVLCSVSNLLWAAFPAAALAWSVVW